MGDTIQALVSSHAQSLAPTCSAGSSLIPVKGSGQVWLQLDINGASTGYYAGLNLDEIYNSAFRSYLVTLKKGDKVKVEGHTNMAVYGARDKHTGFSGLYVSA